jgi:hypothetical protein
MTIVPHEHLDESASDEQIAKAIAGHLLNIYNPGGPYRLAYDYPDRTQPPPVVADKLIHKHKLACVERKEKEAARQWIIKAVMAGQTVYRYAGDDWRTVVAAGSIHSVKYKLDRKFNPPKPRERTDLDDEIPF